MAGSTDGHVGRVTAGELASVKLLDDRSAGRRLALFGEIDLSNASSIGRAAEQALSGAASATVDLTGLRYLDSAGVRMLLQLHEWSSDQGIELALSIDADSIVHRLLEVAGLVDVLPLTPAG